MTNQRFNLKFNQRYWQNSYSPDRYEVHLSLIVQTKEIDSSCNFRNTDKKTNLLRQIGISRVRKKPIGTCSDASIHREFMVWLNRAYNYVSKNARQYLHDAHAGIIHSQQEQSEFEFAFPPETPNYERESIDGNTLHIKLGC